MSLAVVKYFAEMWVCGCHRLMARGGKTDRESLVGLGKIASCFPPVMKNLRKKGNGEKSQFPSLEMICWSVGVNIWVFIQTFIYSVYFCLCSVKHKYIFCLHMLLLLGLVWESFMVIYGSDSVLLIVFWVMVRLNSQI